jgi:hypothetical protein
LLDSMFISTNGLSLDKSGKKAKKSSIIFAI